MADKNHYEVLGFSPQSRAEAEAITPEEIKAAHKKLITKYHTNVWPGTVKSKAPKLVDFRKRCEADPLPKKASDMTQEQKEKARTRNEEREAIEKEYLATPEAKKELARGDEMAKDLSLAIVELTDPDKRNSFHNDLYSPFGSGYGGGSSHTTSKHTRNTRVRTNQEKVDDELKEARAARRRPDLSDIDISGLNLSNYDLHDAIFSKPGKYKSINKTIFNDANLRGADFSGAHISECLFQKAHLEKSKFISSYLSKTLFGDSFLEEVNFSESRINNTSFTNAIASKAIFNNLGYCSDASFTGADIRKAEFKNGTFYRTLFNNAKLQGIDFSGSTLTSIVGFENISDFSNTIFSNTKIQCGFDATKELRFRNAKFDGAELGYYLNWNDADLTGVDLRNSIRNSQFRCKNCILDDAYISPQDEDYFRENAKSFRNVTINNSSPPNRTNPRNGNPQGAGGGNGSPGGTGYGTGGGSGGYRGSGGVRRGGRDRDDDSSSGRSHSSDEESGIDRLAIHHPTETVIGSLIAMGAGIKMLWPNKAKTQAHQEENKVLENVKKVLAAALVIGGGLMIGKVAFSRQ
jgi:uncharacterized protein YjbI with pentapeptide repeats